MASYRRRETIGWPDHVWDGTCAVCQEDLRDCICQGD